MTDWIGFNIVLVFFFFFFSGDISFCCHSTSDVIPYFWFGMRFFFFLFLLLPHALGNLSGFDLGFHNEQRNAFVRITKGICVDV